MEETGFTGIDTRAAASGVTLEEAKRHARVDYSDDDSLIETLCIACTQMAEHEIQHGIISRDGVEGYADDPSVVPAGIREWILIQVSHFYEHREAAQAENLLENPFVDRLLDPYRTWR